MYSFDFLEINDLIGNKRAISIINLLDTKFYNIALDVQLQKNNNNRVSFQHFVYYEFYFHEFRAWMSFDETLKHIYFSFPEGQINMYIKWLQKVLNRC